jgi:hypothetical protein
MKFKKLARRFWLAAAALSMGTLPSDCQMIVRDTFVTETRQTVASALDPTNFDFEAIIRELLGASNG